MRRILPLGLLLLGLAASPALAQPESTTSATAPFRLSVPWMRIQRSR